MTKLQPNNEDVNPNNSVEKKSPLKGLVVEHTPEFDELYLEKSRELLNETNPQLVAMMDRFKK